NKWFGNIALLATKNHRWLEAVPTTPNDLLFPLDATWALALRLAAGYDMPFGVHLSTLFQAYNGLPCQWTLLLRPTDPDGGPSLPSSPSITLRVEPVGARKGPARRIVNLQ